MEQYQQYIHQIPNHTYSSVLSSGETIESVKLQLRGNKGSLIFLTEKSNLRGGGEDLSQPSYKIPSFQTATEAPSNYVLARKNLEQYSETAFRLTKSLKDSLVPTDFIYNSTTGEEILEKLKGCNRLDEDNHNIRKFLIVTQAVVFKCIKNQNLDPKKEAIFKAVLLTFYDRANSIYREEHQNSITTGFASSSIRALVNSERILLTLDQTGFYLNTYEKAFLSKLFKIIDYQFKALDNYRNNVENLTTTWARLTYAYQVLDEASKITISTCLDELKSQRERSGSLELLLDQEQRKDFFTRYWKIILWVFPVLIIVVVSYFYLLRFYLRGSHTSPIQINIHQPSGIDTNIKPLGEPIIGVDARPPNVLPPSVARAPTPVATTGAFNVALPYLLSCFVGIFLGTKVKNFGIGNFRSSNSKIDNIQRQELDEAIHRRKLKLLTTSSVAVENKGPKVESNLKKSFLETLDKMGDDAVNIGKFGIIISLINLVGRRK